MFFEENDDHDHHNMLVNLGLSLAKKCEYGEELDNLTPAEKNVYLCTTFDDEVHNGGLESFYLQSYGNYCYETIDAFKEVGIKKIASLLEKTNALFDGVIPKDEDERNDFIDDQMDEEKEEKIQEFENIIYDIYDDNDSIDKLLYKYVQDNKDQFQK